MSLYLKTSVDNIPINCFCICVYLVIVLYYNCVNYCTSNLNFFKAIQA